MNYIEQSDELKWITEEAEVIPISWLMTKRNEFKAQAGKLDSDNLFDDMAKTMAETIDDILLLWNYEKTMRGYRYTK